jgi:hypothetical protein
MSPSEKAEQIVRMHLPDGPEAARLGLTEAIRWAIVQGQIEARRPPEVELARAPAIVQQIVSFVDEYLLRMRGANYVEQANELEALRARVAAAHGLSQACDASGGKKLMGKAQMARG